MRLLTGVLLLMASTAAAPSFAQDYQYDGQGRLVRVIYADCSTVRYFYDDAGNRVERLAIQGDGTCAGNSAPNAQNDAVILAPSEQRLVFPLLANGAAADSDPDGDPIRIISVSASAGLGLTLQSDRASILVSAPSSVGDYSFNYLIEDVFGLTDSATITVTVSASAPPNTAPVAMDDSVIVEANTTALLNVLSNDTDADGDLISVTDVTVTAGPGSATLDGNQLSYVAPPGSGTATLQYSITDGRGGTAVAQVTVIVNEPPTALDDTATAPSDGQVAIDVLANDSNPDGPAPTIDSVTVISGGGSATTDGAVVSYTAATGPGTATLRYTITDDLGATASADVTVAIGAPAPPNSPPVAVNDTGLVVEGVARNVSVLGNDSDPDGDPLTISSVGPGSRGGVASINGGSLTITSALGVTSETFGYTIWDGQGGTDTATLTVDVNRRPVLLPDAETFASGEQRIIYPLSNDSDPDNDPFEISLVRSVAAGATAEIVNNGSAIRYTASANPGLERFNYIVSDARGAGRGAWVDITVVAPNSPPNAVNDTGLVVEGFLRTLNVLGNDSDPDGDPLTIIAAGPGSQGGSAEPYGGSLRITSALGVTSESFPYTISDGQGGTDTGVMTVDVNRRPTPGTDYYTVAPGSTTVFYPMVNDSDPDGDAFSIESVFSISGGAGVEVINGGSAIRYTAPSAPGPQQFIYRIRDVRSGPGSTWVYVTVDSQCQDLLCRP